MSERVDILLVEDSQDDLELTLSVLKKNSAVKNVAVCRDGAEAVDYLLGMAGYAGRDTTRQPRLVLLDLKLPKMDGIEVLAKLRADERARNVPVVMLTSSSRKSDMEAAYQAGANSYLVKSVDFRQFSKDIRQVCDYWLVLNRSS
jgi:CheY-like chemotaxis protein